MDVCSNERAEIKSGELCKMAVYIRHVTLFLEFSTGGANERAALQGAMTFDW